MSADRPQQLRVVMETLADRYARAKLTEDSATIRAMEKKYGLNGYTYRMVWVGLRAIDQDKDPHQAIADYLKEHPQ